MSTPTTTSDPQAPYTTPPAAPAAGEAGRPGLLVGDSAALFADVRRKLTTCQHRGLVEAGRWYRLEDVLDHAEAALTARLTTEAAAAGEDRERADSAEHKYGVMKARADRGLALATENQATIAELRARLAEEEATTADQAAQLLQLHEERRGLRAGAEKERVAAVQNVLRMWRDSTMPPEDCCTLTELYNHEERFHRLALELTGESIPAQDPENEASPAPLLHGGTEEGEGACGCEGLGFGGCAWCEVAAAKNDGKEGQGE